MMRQLAVVVVMSVGLAACGSQQSGQGFKPYEVDPSGAQGPSRTEIVMPGLPAVPRHVVSSAPSPRAATAVRPYGSDPEASVAAVSTEDTWLRVVDAGWPVWLVAEAGADGAADAARLRSEVVQRSGCLIVGTPASVGRSTVFQLDCS